MVTTPDVDPEVLDLLAVCTADLAPQEDDLVLDLHQRLLDLMPALARTPAGGRPMCQRLVAAALHAAQPGRSTAHLAAVVQRVGADNDGDGFPADQYSEVTHALLHAVRDVFRGEWSSTLSSAWVEYLLWFRGHLMTGVEAGRAAQQGPVPPAPDQARPDQARPDQARPDQALPARARLDDDLDDEGDAEPSYGSLMASMTRGPRRERRGR